MATRSVGTKFMIGLNYVAGLTDIDPPEKSADTLDTTTLDSSGGYRTFTGGFKDGGEVPISGFFEPGDSGQLAMDEAYESGAETDFQIIFPASLGTSWIFKGVVTKFKAGTASLEDLLGFEATIKISGKPTLATTPSANLTTLALTGTSGTLSPTYASGTYSYSYSFTGTSLTVTPTLAGATINLYVDGVLFQAGVTSGSASNAISFAAVGSKKITIIEYETGKTAKTYDVVAIRTA